MKRPSDPPLPEYFGPSILDIIPKDVLTSLILRDWGNFSIADLLRFCNASKDARTKCDAIWTRFFRESNYHIEDENDFPLAFPRFIANEMVKMLFRDHVDEGRHLIIQDGTMGFVVRALRRNPNLHHRYPFAENRYLWIGFVGSKSTEKKTRKREKDILKAMGKWYSPDKQERVYTIPYETKIDVFEIFYNWIVFNLNPPAIYHTQFDKLY
jgi:hypothetical protein